MKTAHSKTETALRLIPSHCGRDWKTIASKSVALFRKKKIARVVFIGTGSSFHVCALAHAHLKNSKASVESSLLTTWDALYDGFSPRPTDLVVVVSHRGFKGLTQRFLQNIKTSNVVLFTSDGAPTGKAHGIFVSPVEESHAHTLSLFGAFCAVTAFLTGLFAQKKEAQFFSDLKKFSETLNALKADVLTEGFPDLFLPKKVRTVTCVGAGEFEILASEVALKFREMVRLAGVGMGLETALHGPLTSFGPTDLILLLPPLSLPRDKMKKFLVNERTSEFVQKLEKTGAELRVPRLSRDMLKASAGFKPAFQAMATLYWAEWAVLGVAYKLDVNPDVNAYL